MVNLFKIYFLKNRSLIFKSVIITFISLILASYFTFPLIYNLNRNFPYNSDFYLNAWVFWYTSHSFYSGLIIDIGKFFSPPFLYPFPYTLAHLDFSLFPSVVMFAPIYFIIKDYIASVNLTILTAYSLNFIFCLICIKKITKNTYGAMIGALIFSYAPMVIDIQNGYLEYLFRLFIPLFFLTLFNYLKSPNVKNSLIVFSIYTLQWFTNIEISIFLSIFAVLSSFLYFYMIFSNKILKTGAEYRQYFYKLFTSAFAGLIIFLPIIYMFFSPYLKYSQTENFKRDLKEVAHYAAVPVDFITTFPKNLIYGRLSYKIASQNKYSDFSYAEHSLFVGLIVIFLLITSIKHFFKTKRNKNILQSDNYVFWLICFILLIFGIVLMFGPFLSEKKTDIKLPYYYLYKIFPPLAAIRTPARVMYICLFFIAFIAARGLEIIIAPSKGLKQTIIFLFIFIIIIVEYTNKPYVSLFALNKINFDLGGKIALFLPMHQMYGKDINDTVYVIQQTTNNFIAINGSTGSENLIGGYTEFTDDLKSQIYTKKWFEMLHALKVGYVVVDKNELKLSEYQELQLAEKNINTEYLKVFEDDNWKILDISLLFPASKCDDNPIKSLDLFMDAYYIKEKGSIYLTYLLNNTTSCDIAFINTDRYLEFRYNYFPKVWYSKKVVQLYPYLPDGKHVEGAIRLYTKTNNRPQTIRVFVKMLNKLYDLPVKDAPEDFIY